MKRKIYYKFNS